MKERQGYECDHCGKFYKVKHACVKHEPNCRKNPVNKRACIGCRFLTKEKRTIYWDAFNGTELSRVVEVLTCKKKGVDVYPFWIDNPYDDGENENIPMPKICDDKEEGFYDDGSWDTKGMVIHFD